MHSDGVRDERHNILVLILESILNIFFHILPFARSLWNRDEMQTQGKDFICNKLSSSRFINCGIKFYTQIAFCMTDLTQHFRSLQLVDINLSSISDPINY